MTDIAAGKVVEKLRTLAELGRPAEVVVQARQALTTWPDSAPIWSELGRALFNLNEFDEAILALERVGALWPNAAWSFRLRSRALRAVSRLTEAIAATETAIQLDPFDFDCHLEVSHIAALQGDRVLVWSAVERARVLAPNTPKVWTVMGVHAAAEQRHEASLGYHQQALALAPDDACWHCNVGDALVRLDRCMVVTAQAMLAWRRGDHSEATRLANRGTVGPHHRRVCPRDCCLNARFLQRVMV